MQQTHIRNVAPMHAANRIRFDQRKANRAIEQLVALGWIRSITEHGLTLTEPRPDGPRQALRED